MNRRVTDREIAVAAVEAATGAGAEKVAVVVGVRAVEAVLAEVVVVRAEVALEVEEEADLEVAAAVARRRWHRHLIR